MGQIHPGLEVTWLGHSGFLIRTPGGKYVAIDPWLGNPLCPEESKVFTNLDLLLLTHGHGDHIGDAATIAKKHNAHVIAIYELASYMSFLGVETTTGMNKGGTVTVDGLQITMTNAVHSSAEVDGGQIKYLGDPAGFVVKCEDGFTFYHAGDTAVFMDMKLIGSIYKPDMAFLPIGGVYTMDPREAAVAIELLGVKKVVPMHYATFPLLAGSPEELKRLTAEMDGVQIYVLEPGKTV